MFLTHFNKIRYGLSLADSLTHWQYRRNALFQNYVLQKEAEDPLVYGFPKQEDNPYYIKSSCTLL